MQNSIQIEGKIIKDEDGNDLIKIIIPPDIIKKHPAREYVRIELLKTYHDFAADKEGKSASCIVEIKPEKTDSRVDRALFELYKEVYETRAGNLVILGYPKQNIESLKTLGFPSLPGFKLADNEQEAKKMIKEK